MLNFSKTKKAGKFQLFLFSAWRFLFYASGTADRVVKQLGLNYRLSTVKYAQLSML
jgi:hypothetical protein